MRPPDPDSVKAAADRAEARAGGKSERRAGRGHLSSVDLLPEEAREDVSWAAEELGRRGRTQEDIRFEFNDRLAKKGIDPISRSAFNRHSLRLAATNAKLDEMDRIFSVVAPRFTAEKVDQSTKVIGEFIKVLSYEILQSRGAEMGTKGAMELARAHLAVIQGQKISSELRSKLVNEERSKLVAAAEAAIGEVDKPIDKTEFLRRIREEIYGIQDAP